MSVCLNFYFLNFSSLSNFQFRVSSFIPSRDYIGRTMYTYENVPPSRPLYRSRPPELLAPAGSLECAHAALYYGADALYLGLRRFSARAEAANFSLDELADLLGYARSLTPRRKVFVTLNTVMQDAELPVLLRLLCRLEELEPDALIVQDLGLARLLRRHFPTLHLHASTQMAVHNLQGVKVLKDLGFGRVNLARELALDEIRRIAAEGGLEVEVFCHGALCYSYSGLCLISSFQCGRSGNRGRCAYPCRDTYTFMNAPGAGETTGLPFSMKDLSQADRLDALRAAGVTALKIEGRMKSALYVAAVTHYYRRLLDGGLADPRERAAAEEDLRTIFSRPWTHLHLDAPRSRDVIDPRLTGHRGAPIGEIQSADRGGPGGQVRLRFRTSRTLERHDGLQIDLPGETRPFGFAFDNFRVASGPGASRPGGGPPPLEAPAGALVEILLPRETPELPPGAPAYCSSSQRVKRSFDFPRPKPGEMRVRMPVDVTAELRADGGGITATVVSGRANGCSATASAELPGPLAPARDPAGTEPAFQKGFARLGDTPFALKSLQLANPAGLFIPASVLNGVRRDVMARLETAWDAALDARAAAIADAEAPAFATPGTPSPAAATWSLLTDRLDTIAAFTDADWDGCGELVVDIGGMTLEQMESGLCELRERLGEGRLRLALPVIVRAWEERELAAKIAALHGRGFRRWQAANLAAWDFLRGAARDSLTADWTLPVFNAAAVMQFMEMGAERVTLSPEDGGANLAGLLRRFGERLTVVMYQDTPLFISENCPDAALAGACPGTAACRAGGREVVAAKGGRYRLCSRGCRSVLIGRSPFSLAPFLKDLQAAGACRFRADFIHRPYAPDEAAALWRDLRAGRVPPGTHAGNFARGLE